MTIAGGYRKYNEISFLRGFSITTVILMHLIQVFVAQGEIPQWLRFAAALGGTGGHVFIFCSGFGLTLSFLNRPLKFGPFLKERFLKIYIPYILIIFIEYFLPHSADRAMLTRQLLSHIFLYKMFFEKYVISYGLQFWFISTIFQLYFLFLPLQRFRNRFSLCALLILGCSLSVIWWIIMELTGLGKSRIWGSFCLQFLWEFVLGMVVAEWFYNRNTVRIPLSVLWCIAVSGLLLHAVTAIIGGWAAAFNDVPALFGYGSTVLLLWYYGKRFLAPIFLRIDRISYEWFLVHTSVFARFYGNIRGIISSEILLALLALLLSIGIAWFYSLLVRNLQKSFRRIAK